MSIAAGFLWHSHFEDTGLKFFELIDGKDGRANIYATIRNYNEKCPIVCFFIDFFFFDLE